MVILEQVIQLVSQSPGSLIYHLGVLFSIEASLAIALGYRNRPDSRRIVLAAVGMLVGRLALMGVALLDWQGVIGVPSAVLPPLERAADAVGTWLLVWALLPLFDRRPQWSDVLAGGISLLLVAVYLFFAADWYSEAVRNAATYNTSQQETVWEVIQLMLLGAASMHTLIVRRGDWVLRFGILALLFGAHLVHFGWALPGDNVAGWERLGQLIVYPLFAVSTYRTVVGGVLRESAALSGLPRSHQVEQARLLGAIAAARDEPAIIQAALEAIAAAAAAETVAYCVPSVEPADERYKPETEFRCAALMNRGRSVAPPPELPQVSLLGRVAESRRAEWLLPGGPDGEARLSLLSSLSPENGHEERSGSPLWVQPVSHEDQRFGLLLVRPAAGQGASEHHRQLTTLMTAQFAARLADDRAFRRLVDQAAGCERARQGVIQARRRLEEMDALASGRRARIEELEKQLAGAAAESGISPMAMLPDGPASKDDQLAWSAAARDRVTWAVQELRRPLALILGYADLLLGSPAGTPGATQQGFLEKVRAGSDRAASLLNDLTQATVPGLEWPPRLSQPVDPRELIVGEVRRQQHRYSQEEIELHLDPNLPMLQLDRDGLTRVLSRLLSDAVGGTARRGGLSVAARYCPAAETDPNGGDRWGYLFVTVTSIGAEEALPDQEGSGGDRGPFDVQSGAAPDEGRIELPPLKELAEAHGGRVWIDSPAGTTKAVHLVLPVRLASGLESG